MVRRTQAERSDETRLQLTAAAQRLFGQAGYAATSIDAVAAAAGVTKGAAYHHFNSKPDLFRAVFVREQEQFIAALEQAGAEAPDADSALRLGCRTFLERCLEPAFRQIVLLDGPVVLGWDVVREIESDHILRVLTAGMRAAAAEAPVVEDNLNTRCQMFFGALCEAGMLLARSENPEDELAAVVAETERLLNAAVGSGARTSPVGGA